MEMVGRIGSSLTGPCGGSKPVCVPISPHSNELEIRMLRLLVQCTIECPMLIFDLKSSYDKLEIHI